MTPFIKSNAKIYGIVQKRMNSGKRRSDMAQDMTTGSLSKGLVRLSVPLILSGILQQMYNWTDAFILGNVEGEYALAAVGATTSISEFAILVITGFAIGISVLTAQTYGKGNKEDVPKILSLFTILIGCICVVMAIVCIVAARHLLELIRTPANVLQEATIYLRIIFMGIPCMAVYNIYSAVIRGVGDSKAAFLSVLTSTCMNVVLDIILVYICRCGVMGAAIATLVSQCAMMLFMIFYVDRKYKDMKLRRVSWAENKEILQRGTALGMPTALQSGVTAGGNLLLQNFMNGFGVHTVTAITTAYRIDGVIMLPIVNLGAAISTMVAQNVGANKAQRAHKGFGIGVLMMVTVTLGLALLISYAGGTLIALFGVIGEAEVIGGSFFDIIARFYIVYGVAIAVKSYLEGRGDMFFSGISSFAVLGVRIVLSYGLQDSLGNNVIAYAEGIAWIVLLVMCLGRFISLSVKEKAKCKISRKII